MATAEKAYSHKGFAVEDVLRRLMEGAHCSTQTELAHQLGVRRAAVTDAKRRGSIPADWILRLCRRHNLNPLWIESGLGAMHIGENQVSETPEPYNSEEFAYIPKLAAVPRMGPQGLETDESVESYYAFRREWLQRKGRVDEMRLLAVAGDSMEPTLRDGDIVLVDQSQKDILFGKIYVVGIDEGVMVKRLDKRPGKLVLISDNRSAYDPVEVNLSDEAVDCRIVGRVIWMARELF